MENATNALIMAGSVLIALIIVSLFVYMFSSMGSIAKDFQEEIDSKSVQKFNEQFEKYVGRNDLTPQDVLSAYSLAESINKYYGEKMVVALGITSKDFEDMNKFLSNEEEEKNLTKDEYQDKLAWGIYNGITEYFN